MNHKKAKKQEDSNSDDEMINFYEIPEFKKYAVQLINPNYNIETMPLKHSFRMLIIGATGSGKSNILLNILSKMSGTFEYIHIFTQDKNEQLYEGLADKIPDDMLKIYEGIETFNDMDLSKLPEGQTLMVFDDMIVEGARKHKKIAELFIRGRKMMNKKGISVIYLSQSYFDIEPSVIRKNADKLVLKKINGKYDKNAIIRDGVGLDLSKEQLHNMFNYCVKSKDDINNFMLIDKSAPDEYRIRKNFKTILNPEDFH